MNEINAVKLKMKSGLPGKRDLYEKQLEDNFWSLVDVVGVGNAVNFILDVIDYAVDEIMNSDEKN